VVHICIDAEEFVVDLFVIPLDDYDMVLGMHWLHNVGPILWDFARAQMSCWHDDHRVVWQGSIVHQATLAAQAMATTDLLDLLLEEFQDVFTMPTCLPPPCRYNHHIHLLLETVPVLVQPYRYPQLVKDELEW
jgi:hypothetical protein